MMLSLGAQPINIT